MIQTNQISTFYNRFKATIGFFILLVGVLLALYVSNNGKDASIRQDAHTRSVICLVLTQIDGTTLAQEKAGRITKVEAQESLLFTAQFRKELGPAPYCNPNITKANEATPFHRAAVDPPAKKPKS